MSFGPDKITNGSFDDSSTWTFPNGGYDSANGRVAWDHMEADVICEQTLTGLTPGRAYRGLVDLNIVGGTVKALFGNVLSPAIPAGTASDFYFVPIAAITKLQFRSYDIGNGQGEGWLDNVVFEEIIV